MGDGALEDLAMQADKAAYTAMEVAAMVGLTTPRFYQLIKRGIFPAAKRLGGGRPVYPKDLAEDCAIIRQVGIGWNGEPVTFNVKRKGCNCNVEA